MHLYLSTKPNYITICFIMSQLGVRPTIQEAVYQAIMK